MSEVNLYNLNLEELKEQARILGIVVKGNPSADTLRDRIRKAVNIEPAEKPESADADEEADRKKNWVKVFINEDEADQRPVFVGVNGKNFWIRRGEHVLVPPEVATVLGDAKQVITDAKGKQTIKHTYPFSVTT